MFGMVPVGDNIVVKRSDPRSMTSGGILLPDKAQETPQEGIVVAVGPGKPLAGGGFYEMTVKPEDRILFKPFPGPDIMVEDEKFVVMAEDRVLVILKG